MKSLVGKTIAGKYLVKRLLGEGGMGAVYEGEHVEIGKRIAIKVIQDEFAHHPELAQRFRREARAASAVESEHIVQVFDVGQDPEAGLYMVMEMLAGSDLASRLERAGGALPLDEAISLMLQAARGLSKAHAAGVVHRDLKPANLFITPREDGSPCVKILDFGISKLIGPRSEAAQAASKSKGHALTREGAVIGTPQYMSPEQAQGLPVDARTDVWSLGAVAYEVFGGKSAFALRDTYEQMIIQIVTTRAESLTRVAPSVPPAIAAIIDDALVPDPDKRLADMATFVRRLTEAARTSTATGANAAVQAPVSSQRGVVVGSDPDLRRAALDATLALKPETGAGVVVAARTGPEATAKAASTRPAAAIAVGVVAAVALAGVIGVAILKKPRTTTELPAPSALVASAAAAGGIAEPPVPAPSPAPPVVETAANVEPARPPTRADKPPVETPVPPTKPKAKAEAAAKGSGGSGGGRGGASGPGQYGAAGVSTAY